MKKGRRVEKVKFLISSTKKSKTKQLELFHENLEEFQLPNSFSETVKTLGLKLGVQLSDEMIQLVGRIWTGYRDRPVREICSTEGT